MDLGVPGYPKGPKTAVPFDICVHIYIYHCSQYIKNINKQLLLFNDVSIIRNHSLERCRCSFQGVRQGMICQGAQGSSASSGPTDWVASCTSAIV